MVEAQRLTIAIAATFTAEPIEEALVYWMRELDIPSEIMFAPYNQVFQQLLDPLSVLSKNQSGINAVLIRSQDWQKYEDSSTTGIEFSSGEYENIERNVRDLIGALKSAASGSGTAYLVCLCPVSPAVMGHTGHSAFFKQMEELMVSELTAVSGVYLVTTSELAATYPVSQYYDLFADKAGHIPFTDTFFTALASMIARKTVVLRNKAYKVIVLDCDQTLWEGLSAEDGPDGIRIDPAHHRLQEFMVEQYEAGMLLSLCSKNNQEDVIQVFDRHPEMPLKRDNILSWRINWKTKSENIRSLAEELQLGLDTFIFIDDNPIECAQVQAECPEVLTLQLPQEPREIPKFLAHVWAFDHLKVTKEDKERTNFYKRNIMRNQLQKETSSLGDFLAGLDLEIHISELSDPDITRVSQLTQRTSQFNFTTIRRSEVEIQKLCRTKDLECLVVEVKDRFGDYGLVGVVMFRAGAKAIEVDTFLLSCRVLGRGVEHRMLARLGEVAKERGLRHLNVSYIRTQRNQPAFDFLNRIGAKFKRAPNNGLLFRFPAEFAAALTYTADAAKPKQNKQPVSDDSSPVARIQAPSKLLSRIATELYDPKQILENIHAQRHGQHDVQSIAVEVEKVLGRHPAIGEIAVRLRDDVSDHKHLVAYIVPDGEHSLNPTSNNRFLSPDSAEVPLDKSSHRRHKLHDTLTSYLLSGSELRGFLKKQLPRFMAPLDLMFIEALPRTRNGELDHHALPTPNETNADLDRSFWPPRTPIEETLAEIWAELLGIDDVGIYDNFFDLGGQSLLGTVLMSRVYSTFQVELPLLSIFESPTIAEIAQLIEQYLIGQLDPEELSETLKEVDSLSDEEVEVLLSDEKARLSRVHMRKVS